MVLHRLPSQHIVHISLSASLIKFQHGSLAGSSIHSYKHTNVINFQVSVTLVKWEVPYKWTLYPPFLQ